MPGSIPVVDILTLEIQRLTGASARLEDIVSFECNAAQESRPVHTLRRQRTPRGFRHGARNITGSFEVVVPLGGLEVDFEAMQVNKEPSDMIVERGPGGRRKTVINMLITEVNEGSTGEGEHTFRCTFVASDYAADPTT